MKRIAITLLFTLLLWGCTVIWVASSSNTSVNTRGFDSESSSDVSSEVSNLKDELNNLNQDVKVIDEDVNSIDKKVESVDSIVDMNFKKK